MVKKATHLKRLLDELSDFVPEACEADLERIVDIVHRHDQRNRPQLEDPPARSNEHEGLPWHFHYEDSVASVVRSEAKKDPEIQAFRDKVLGGKLFPELEQAIRWVAELADHELAPEEGTELRFDERRERDLELIQSMPERAPFIVFPMIDRLIGLFFAIPLPQDPPCELQELKTLCQRISRRYGWLEEAATYFILLGNTISTPAYLVHSRKCSETPCMTRIIMQVDPALPPELVAQIYRKERGKLKRTWHKSSVKHLKLAEFVSRRSDLNSWREKWNEWNSTNRLFGPRSQKDWQYRPPIPVRQLTKDELAGLSAHYVATNSEHLIPSLDRQWVNDWDAYPPNYEELIEIGYHNFRRDASRARRRLLDPYGWKPRKRTIERSEKDDGT